jgi:hypothetical protein
MIDLALAWRAGATCFVRIWVAGFQHDPQKRTYQHQEVNALQFSSPEAAMVPLPIIVAIIVVLYILSTIKILWEYECGVIFRLGRLLPHAKGPGIIPVFAPVDRVVRISLRQEALEVKPQDIITRDNVTLEGERSDLPARN